MSHQPPPTCLAIILCEDAYRVHNRSNFIIVNTFHGITMDKVPSEFAKITVLTTLTNGHGQYQTHLSIVDAAAGATVIELSGNLNMPDPLMIVDTQLTMRRITFRQAGKHWVELRVDGTLIMQRPFFVSVKRKQADAEPADQSE